MNDFLNRIIFHNDQDELIIIPFYTKKTKPIFIKN